MIFVTQGSDQSIGLEVFIKSYLCLSGDESDFFHLFASKENVLSTFESLNLTYELSDNSILFGATKLRTTWVDNSNDSLNSLLKALESISSFDILLTLPSDKTSLAHDGKNCAGYTEFLRKYYQRPELCMVFKGRQNTIALVTDHIPLKDVPLICANEVVKKVDLLLSNEDFKDVDSILLSGINPHAGEAGNIGKEDQVLTQAIDILKTKHKKLRFSGPLPADTIWKNPLFHSENTITFFAYHDQGLGVFKTQNGFIGANITYGLDFTRMSVDHGTAPDIALKNQADYMGCLYVVRLAIDKERKRRESRLH